MADLYVENGGGTPGSGTYRGDWQPSQTWAVGDRVVPTRAYGTANAKGYVYECTTAGAGGGTQPTWVFTTPETSTTTDGAAVFTCRLIDDWANATTRLEYASLIDAAGDNVYVSHTHVEQENTGNITLAWAGTQANPVRIISVNKATMVPTYGAQVGITSGYYTWSGSVYCYGLNVVVGTSYVVHRITMASVAGNRCVFDNCRFYLGGGYNGYFSFNFSYLYNCTFGFNGGFPIFVQSCVIEGGGIESGSTTNPNPNGFFICAGDVAIRGFDVSVFVAGQILFGSMNNNSPFKARAVRLKTHPSLSTLAKNDLTNAVWQAELIEGDGAAQTFGYRKMTNFGSIVPDTAVFLDAFSPRNGARISHKATGSSWCGPFSRKFEGAELEIHNAVTGSARKVTVEIIHGEAAALTNEQVALRAMFSGDAGSPLGSWVSSEQAYPGQTPTTHAASTASWSLSPNSDRKNSTAYTAGNIIGVWGKLFICTTSGTTAGAEPAGYATADEGDTVTDNTAVFRRMRRQKLELTFTPQLAGAVLCYPLVLASGLTVWYSPSLALSAG